MHDSEWSAQVQPREASAVPHDVTAILFHFLRFLVNFFEVLVEVESCRLFLCLHEEQNGAEMFSSPTSVDCCYRT